MIKFNIALFVISVGVGIANIWFRYWVYNRDSESELMDQVKIFSMFADVVKDLIFAYIILSYLVYHM